MMAGNKIVMKNALTFLSFSVIALLALSSFSTFKSKQLIWVEFCDRGNIGKCEVKQCGGDGFRCFAANSDELRDCGGSHWQEF